MAAKCAELRAEERLYELFTIGVALVLATGYAVLLLRGAVWGEAGVSAENAAELAAFIAALYLSLPFHELAHYAALRAVGAKPKLSISRFKEYLWVLKSYDGSEKPLAYSEVARVLVAPLAAMLLPALGALAGGSLDYPFFALALGNAAFCAWDVYLLIALRGLPEARFVYMGTAVWLVGDCEVISGKLAKGLSGERYAKHWAGWTWFFFVILLVMFFLVELGSIGFRQGFTLSVGPLLVFSVEPVKGGFRTAFNPPGAFALSAALAVPFAYLSKKVLEWYYY